MKRINPVTNKPFRRGDKNEPGDYFFAYVKNKKIIDGYYYETWISQERVESFNKLALSGYKKTCTKCGQSKAVKDHFYSKYSSKDGFDPSCIVCFLAKNKRWIDQNQERHKELTERWYIENKKNI